MAKQKMTLKDLDQVEVPEIVAEVPNELWDDIRSSVVVATANIDDGITRLKETVKRRENAYIARGVWNQAIQNAREDQDTALGMLFKQLLEIQRGLGKTRTVGGVKVPFSPHGSIEQELLQRLFDMIREEETRIKIKVAEYYGFKNEAEVESIINRDQKQFNQKGAK